MAERAEKQGATNPKGGPSGPRDQFVLFFLGRLGKLERRPNTRPAFPRPCG